MSNSIKILKIEPCEKSKYITLKRVTYLQNDSEKTWDIVKTHDSVSILLYHNEKKSFLLVKQFRPAVFLNNSDNDGYTYELCAGLMDKELSEKETIKEEVLEECGYEIELENIVKINSIYSSVGVSGSKQHIFFGFIDESAKRNEGGGTKDEDIELFFLHRDMVKEFLYDEKMPKTPGLLFCLLWFFNNENNLTRKS
ncbi:MAG: NUDIX domain-containing protein [Campylobacteraceae bacterium]|jgi:UDP-sugar diphosphatase|nr:NUDIX domain-containing protein [Campylobacteraceae bacterium]